MLTSKQLLEQTGISRATLNNYIAAGLLPKPEVKRVSPAPGEALTTLGYFPEWALTRVMEIQAMKKSGISMQAITQQFQSTQAVGKPSDKLASTPNPHQTKVTEGDTPPSAEMPAKALASDLFSAGDASTSNGGASDDVASAAMPYATTLQSVTESQLTPASASDAGKEAHQSLAQHAQSEPENVTFNSIKSINNQLNETKNESNLLNSQVSQPHASESMSLTIEDFPYPAYLMSYDFQVIWLNQASRQTHFPDGHLPERIEERCLIPTLLNWSSTMTEADSQALFRQHFALVQSRFNHAALTRASAALPIAQREFLEHAYQQASQRPGYGDSTLIETPTLGLTRMVSMSFREGVLITYVPEHDQSGQILDWLSRRDHVIRSLLGQRLPVLTPLVAIVADLQNSVRICAELPPDEYFQLINDIWSAMDPIFRKHYGAYGKHTGDGMVYYFFPQPDKNYLANALQCACEIRETMRLISNRWALKKNWTNQLYMNIGLCEGEEWLGTFKTTTNYELVVLGETINIAARLSDLARFGKIWATKSLVSKLSVEERDALDYGVMRAGLEQEVFVANSYAQVASLVNRDDPKGNKLLDIASLAVTEIRGFK